MNKLKMDLKSREGITLISLVVTIIILIILASISISMILGNNGLLNKTQTASDETKKSQATETMNLKITNIQISSYTETQSKYCSTSRNGYSSCSSSRTCSLSGGSGNVPLTNKTTDEDCYDDCDEVCDEEICTDTCIIESWTGGINDCDDTPVCTQECYEDCEWTCDTYYYCDYGGYIDVSVTLYKAIYSGIVTPSQTNY